MSFVIENKFFPTVEGFKAYLKTLTFDAWRPSFVVQHNTSEPSLALYKEWKARTPPTTLLQYMTDMMPYYSGMGWNGGPHLFVAPDGIGVFNPLTKHGTHSPSWNRISWGVECVGEFDTEPFQEPQKSLLIGALAALHELIGLDPATLRFHKEDPETTHKGCPGPDIGTKASLIAAVQAVMTAAHPGEHDTKELFKLNQQRMTLRASPAGLHLQVIEDAIRTWCQEQTIHGYQLSGFVTEEQISSLALSIIAKESTP